MGVSVCMLMRMPTWARGGGSPLELYLQTLMSHPLEVLGIKQGLAVHVPNHWALSACLPLHFVPNLCSTDEYEEFIEAAE